ncbi:MAG TPA: hypothetical protein VK900_02030 [Anaerolineales bacterium]|nr:hypothetical protein [Anaerolineales bacterium]
MFSSPRFLFRFGIFLMIVGIVLPFLMSIRMVESTFLLNFLSYGASVAGLSLGSIGWMMGSRERKE